MNSGGPKIMLKQQAKELFTQAMTTLWSHKFRSFLTVLGVVIGTATVIGVASLAKGLESGVKELFDALRLLRIRQPKCNEKVNGAY